MIQKLMIIKNTHVNLSTVPIYIYSKNFFKKRKRIDAIKGGKQEVTEIDDIIHNSSYRQSDSAFLTEFGGL